ncbi:hypothetical protein [Streptomyces paromomycinus]|uniref:Uncharacterized protein n=1 Tax=Streptomyces paromomycinus TaxID=92743 RepID=A0A401WBI6_STREY|nr:hypothetical protein [Streptomyces paromomycinus]GCD46688.1 hypothetical protein GKJPGBOP_06439 [Streptomyces paromomycinus]
MRLRLPEERPATPPAGFKLAHPVISHDGTRTGFAGVSLGGALPYGFVDEARCVYGRRHRCPALRCDCGFYCLHTVEQALALVCASEYRRAVLLEVTVLGAYIRFERGMRYERQRVRVARVGACACGRMPCAFADAGWGRTGWRVLTAVCAECAARRGRTAFARWTAVSFAEFVRCGGGALRIVAGGEPEAGEEGRQEVPAEVRSVPELAAEASLMQARLDWLQRQLARFTGGGKVS